jgi:hypothetical protein
MRDLRSGGVSVLVEANKQSEEGHVKDTHISNTSNMSTVSSSQNYPHYFREKNYVQRRTWRLSCGFWIL